MHLSIATHLVYDFAAPTDVLLQLEAAHLPEQDVSGEELWLTPVAHFARVTGHDGLGTRIWTQVNGRMVLDYKASVVVNRGAATLEALPVTPPRLLPGEVVDYLMPSRFCPSDRFVELVDAEFAGLEGGQRVAAIREWVATHLTYVPGSSTSQTCASDTYIQRQGVCRDYAHLVVTLCRAAAFPARLCSVYALGVTPPDFHALAEVFLDGAWHLVDATGMADPASTVQIGVGRDASDVPFLSSFGSAAFVEQSVTVEAIS